AGTVNCSRSVSPVDFLHDRSGPTPVRKSIVKPIGTIHRLKNAGPTLTSLPVANLKIDGNKVANVTKKAAASSTQLFTRNANSRDKTDSSPVAGASARDR